MLFIPLVFLGEELFRASTPQDPHRLKIRSRLIWAQISLYGHSLHVINVSSRRLPWSLAPIGPGCESSFAFLNGVTEVDLSGSDDQYDADVQFERISFVFLSRALCFSDRAGVSVEELVDRALTT